MTDTLVTEDPYQAGMQAASSGGTADENPYDGRTKQGREWLAGYKTRKVPTNGEVFGSVKKSRKSRADVDYSGVYVEQVGDVWEVSIRGKNNRVLLSTERVNYKAAKITVDGILHAAQTVYELDGPNGSTEPAAP